MSFRRIVQILRDWKTTIYSRRRCTCGGLLILRRNIRAFRNRSKGVKQIDRTFYKRCTRCKQAFADPQTVVMNAEDTRRRYKTGEKVG
jgi:hypothetical protein